MKWIANINKKAFEDAESKTVFSWFHRSLGLVYLVAFIPLIWEITPLIGQNGLQSATELLGKTYSSQGYVASFLQFPSLYHIYPYNSTLYFIIILGSIASISMVMHYQVFFSAVIAWICFLSITSIGGDFFIIIIDLFLAEVGFLSIFSTYSIQYKNYIPKIIWWVFKLLNFKLWFSMGVIKFYHPAASWTTLTFFDTFFQAQPMPTPLAKLFHQCPKSLKITAIAFLFIGEMLVPFLIFGKKILRWVAVLTFVLISILIQLNGNYGYFNVLSIVIAITIFKDSDLRIGSYSEPSHYNSNTIKVSLFSHITLQVFYILLLIHPKPFSSQNHFNFIHTYFKTDTPFSYPLKLISYWRLCNPYGVFKSIPIYHSELRISGSIDGNEWKVYEFKYLPSSQTDYLGFYAPYYPRLDHLMFYETLSERNAKYNTLNHFYKTDIPWSCKFIKQLINNNSASVKLLKTNPFNRDKAPKYIKIELYRLAFSSKKEVNWESTKMPFEAIYTSDSVCSEAILPYKTAMESVFN